MPIDHPERRDSVATPASSPVDSPATSTGVSHATPSAVVAGVALFLLAGVGLWFLSPRMDAQTLVVYCAHDAEFAEPILRDFERESGRPLAIRYDTEATKSLGLVNRLLAERGEPQCDVFWNNELLGTLELARAGALEPYSGPGGRRIPPEYRDESGLWTGFAARLRMYIVFEPNLEADADAVEKQLAAEDLSRCAIAKPMFGTTLTQYCLWWSSWGGEELRRRHHDWRRRGIRIADGNAATKNLVAAGACDLGFTDSDDYFVARDNRQPVEGLPVRVDGRTICIPNTVAIIQGTRRRAAAQSLVDFLLSEKTELALAKSSSRQIPLGEMDDSQLPSEVRPLRQWAREATDLRPLINVRGEVLDWLRAEYVP